jgi:hypothetical protein
VPALVPPSAWLDSRVPAAPSLSVHSDAGGRSLGIAPGDDTAVRFWIVQLRIGGAWHVVPLAGDRRRLPIAPGADRAVVYGVSRTGVEGIWTPADIPSVARRTSPSAR